MQRVGIRTTAVSISTALVLSVVPIIPLIAQQPGGTEGTSPETLTSFSGGAAKAKRARTQTSASTLPAAANVWVNLSDASLTYTVATGQNDTFNVAFSAECGMLSAGRAHIRIRVRNAAGFDSFMSPYDGGQVFCSTTSTDPQYATYKGNWVRRLSPDTYTLQVQFMLTGQTRIDDWTFELVVYD
jgi:hypothetical protein